MTIAVANERNADLIAFTDAILLPPTNARNAEILCGLQSLLEACETDLIERSANTIG